MKQKKNGWEAMKVIKFNLIVSLLAFSLYPLPTDTGQFDP